MISKAIIDQITAQFKLDSEGIHGLEHWSRVRRNGLRIAKRNGADIEVIEYFAFLHDSQRLDEDRDPEHGHRAALFIETMDLPLSEPQVKQLQKACFWHTYADPGDDNDYDITIRTCFDADRLDLTRLGFQPDIDRLFTKEAKIMSSLEAREITIMGKAKDAQV